MVLIYIILPVAKKIRFQVLQRVDSPFQTLLVEIYTLASSTTEHSRNAFSIVIVILEFLLMHTLLEQRMTRCGHTPYKNLEHALHTLYTHFAFVLHSFCALVNHILHYVQNVRRKQNIGHMCKMCTGGIHTQYVCSLRIILKICAKYAQFAHNLLATSHYTLRTQF